MNRTVLTRIAAVLAVMAALAADVGLGGPALASQGSRASQYKNIDGEGSSWAGPAWHQWEVDAANDGVTFNYTPNGSSAGRDDFAKQVSAMFADSEIPFKGDADDPQDNTYPSFPYSMLPIVAGGTAFAYDLPVGGANFTKLQLNMATIAGIFSGKITMWNASQIRKTNPGVQLPAQRITVVVRSDGSGATAQFKLWMLRQFPADYRYLASKTGGNPNAASSYYPVGSLGACKSNSACFVAQSGSNGVTTYTQHTPYTIDYDEYAYALDAGIPVAKVENAHHFFTLPTPDAVAVALTQAIINLDKNSANYLSQNLSKVYGYMDPRSYPMSMYTYEMIPDQATQVLQNPQGATLAWVSTNAVCQWQYNMGPLGYSPLPMNLVLSSMQQIEKIPGINSAVKATITNTFKGVTSGTSNPCNSPTFKPGQSPSNNVLVQKAPFPPGCNAACQAPWKGSTGANSGPIYGTHKHNSGTTGAGQGAGAGHTTGPGSANTSSPPAGSSTTGSGGSGPGCNAVTGVCSSSGATNASATGAGTATVIPQADGWTTPQTLGTLLAILLLAVLVAPPVVAAMAGRKGRRQ